jgi:CRISPR/Cas system endoribonuclease Cas6 (RAMP superfamily)
MLFQRIVLSKQRLLAGALALMILVVAVVACAHSTPASRNHVAPEVHPLFVQISFTKNTTYEQAVALLQQVGAFPYPWNCDDPRNPTPPTTAQQQANFSSSHSLLFSYPTQAQLNTLAASDLVSSIDAVALVMCAG